MKKIAIVAILFLGFASLQAVNNSDLNIGNRNHNQYSNTGIPKDNLPKNIIDYLNKEYSDYIIMISKKKDNGYYYVKIRYNQNARRPYYRNLVFDQNGNPVRG